MLEPVGTHREEGASISAPPRAAPVTKAPSSSSSAPLPYCPPEAGTVFEADQTKLALSVEGIGQTWFAWPTWKGPS